MKKQYLVILSVIILLSFVKTQGQQLDEAAWEKVSKGINYLEKSEDSKSTVQKEKGEPVDFDSSEPGNEKLRKKEKSAKRDFSGSSNTELPQWLSTLLIISVIGLLLYVIVSIVLKNPAGPVSSKAIPSSISDSEIDEIEKNPFENDLEKYIHQALENKNLKLAIRFSYIYVIRLLSENGHIQWKRHKTNRSYYIELDGKQRQHNFLALTRIFEQLWYGNKSFSADDLKSSLRLFEVEISHYKSDKAK